MVDKKQNWQPDDDDVLKELIRSTIKSAGVNDPSILPSKIRAQIRARISGDTNIDDYVKKVLAETRKG